MTIRRSVAILALLFITVLSLPGCNRVVHRFQTIIIYCSVCGAELSRTENDVFLHRSSLRDLQPVVEKHTGRCRDSEHVLAITTCPTCGRRISEEWTSLRAWKGNPPPLGKEVYRDATAPCPVCEAWDAISVVAEPAALKEGVTVLGPYRTRGTVDWANDSVVWARVGLDDSPDALVEIRDGGPEQGWTARRLIDWQPGDGGGLYIASPVAEGRYLLAVMGDDFWLSEIPPATGKLVSVQRLGQGLIFDMPPDLAATVLYPTYEKGGEEEPPLYKDFKSGRTERWAAVSNRPFPVTGAGAAWSPGGDSYLHLVGRNHRYLVQPVPAGKSIPVSDPDETAYFGEWSPDGSMVAYNSFEGDPWPYVSSADDLATPMVWEALKIWSMADRQTYRLAVSERWVLSVKACWSPDSKAVAFAAGGLKPPGPDPDSRESWGDVYLSCLGDDGWSTPVALTEDGKSGFACLPLEWSPDGKALLISVGAKPSAPAERRIIRLDDGPEPRVASALVLGDVRAANWVGTDRLVTVTVGGDEHERLEIRSAGGLVLEVLDRPDLEPGQFGHISYRLSPSRTRIVWSVDTNFRYSLPQDRKVWIKACRLDTSPTPSAP